MGLIAKRGFLAFKCINASDVDGEEEEVAAVSDGDVDDGSENHQCDHGLSSLCPGSTCGRSSFCCAATMTAGTGFDGDACDDDGDGDDEDNGDDDEEDDVDHDHDDDGRGCRC